MAYYSSNSSGIDMNGPTYFKAFEDRVAAQQALYEEELSRVSVEGHDTSLGPTDIRAIYSLYFHKCGDIFNVVIPSDPASGVVERVGYIYLRDKWGQERALALSGSNVGFPLSGRNAVFLRMGLPSGFPLIGTRMGGWNVVVKALPKQSCEFSPHQVTAARRLTSTDPVAVVVTGYDTSRPADDVRSALFRLFSPCGEIIFLEIDEDPSQPGLLKRSGYVCLAGEEARTKAIGLDGTDLGGWNVAVRTLEPNGQPLPSNDAHIPNGWEGPPGYRRSGIHPFTATTSH